MNIRPILFLIFFLSSLSLFAQRTRITQEAKPAASVANGVNSSGDKKIITTSRKANGYIVYRKDTIKGLIMLSLNGVYLDHTQNNGTGKFYDLKFKDRNLKTVMMYNADNKPLCLTRVQESDKKLMRLLHEGKLTVYDDWVGYVYTTEDVDPFLLVVSHNGEVETLSSFSKGGNQKRPYRLYKRHLRAEDRLQNKMVGTFADYGWTRLTGCRYLHIFNAWKPDLRNMS